LARPARGVVPRRELLGRLLLRGREPLPSQRPEGASARARRRAGIVRTRGRSLVSLGQGAAARRFAAWTRRRPFGSRPAAPGEPADRLRDRLARLAQHARPPLVAFDEERLEG